MATERQVDVLIVGAGIAGLLLGRALRARGKRVALAHDPSGAGASEAAVGLLNPVRGRRCTLAWRAAEAFAAARDVYGALAATDAGRALFREIPIVRAFSSAEERAAFDRKRARIEQDGWPVREHRGPSCGFRPSEHGVVEISGGGAVAARELVAWLRDDARAAGCLIERRCSLDALRFEQTLVSWQEIGLSAERVVLARGAEENESALGVSNALRPVAGEALLVHIPALSPERAYVCGHHLAPCGPGRFACGGTKLPGQAMAACSPAGRSELERFLEDHLDVPWSVEAHWCGVRAATLDTHPMVGPAPLDPRVFLFNGFGSQGFSHAPWMAHRLVDHLVHGTPLPPEVDPRRFLARSTRPTGARWHAVDRAHALVERHLAPGDRAIDLTAGTGGDTLHLACAVGSDGAVIACDIQPEAIEATRHRLSRAPCETSVDLHCVDHARLASVVPRDWRGRVGAAVANLGYLPGSKSEVTTRPESTLAAFTAALGLLRADGVLVAVIYTQHPGGLAELAALERWVDALDRGTWTAAWERAPDNSPRAPVVLAVTRRSVPAPGSP